MNDPKIIFFDVDGTLIDMNTKRISGKMLETLTRLKEKGKILCLATGRTPVSLPQIPGVEFDVFLTFNGSYCFNRQQDIFSNPIPAEDVRTIIQNAASINRPVSLATKQDWRQTEGIRIWWNTIPLPSWKSKLLTILKRYPGMRFIRLC